MEETIVEVAVEEGAKEDTLDKEVKAEGNGASGEPSTPPAKPPFKRTDKVAIVGFAPSSMKLAPFADEEWEIWTLNNIYTAFNIPRWDRWFELHRNFRTYPKYHDNRVDAGSIIRGDARPVTKEINHLEWLREQAPGKPIYFWEKFDDIPASEMYPKDELSEWCIRQGFYQYFTNSISYMVALAIAEGYKTIGLWGVDMAAQGEYQKERPSVEYWWAIGQALRINMVLPKESELMKARWYGFDDDSAFVAKAEARYQELMQNHQNAVSQSRHNELMGMYFKGAAEDCEYFKNNWGNGE